MVLIRVQSLSRRLGAIALLALLVRAVLPQGYMIANAETGSGRYLTVQICDGHNIPAIVIDLATGKKVDDSRTPSGRDAKPAPCAFAASPTLFSPVQAAEPVIFRPFLAATFLPSDALRPGRGIPAPPPPATGPPSAI